MIAFVDRDPRTISEHSLQVRLLGIIDIGKTHPDIFAFAIPNAGRRSWNSGKKMNAEGLMKGVADLCIMMLGGMTGWLELKRPKGGRQSDEQKGFEARCKRTGHLYALVKTLEEAIAVLVSWGVLRDEYQA
jgi:hypothetical protein